MKTLLVYTSRTGNTERVAKEIYEELVSDFELDIKKLEELDEGEEENYDFIITGFWIDQAYPVKNMRKFIESLKNKRIGMFATIGADPDSYHGERTKENLEELVDETSTLCAKFMCNGKVDPNLISKLKGMNLEKLPPGLTPDILTQMIEAGEKSREPNEEDFKNARKIFRKVFEEMNK